MDNLLTTEQAASRLQVSKVRVRRLIADGRLVAEKRGRDYFISQEDLDRFVVFGKKRVGRPPKITLLHPDQEELQLARHSVQSFEVGRGQLFLGDVIESLKLLDDETFQAIVADPPYFNILEHSWDREWQDSEDYLDWTVKWVTECARVLKSDGLIFIFGQLGKKEHVWLHVCSELVQHLQFHDMLIWDRVVGYNERSDSFTPQYEMILVLRKKAESKPFFNKDAVRIPYDEETIQAYLKDKRYKNIKAREAHLRKGKYATNLLRFPSLKGASKEKVGHPTQKPCALIESLVLSSSQKGDQILDPFIGSGTTGVVCEMTERAWVGIDNERSYIEMSRKRILTALGDPELQLQWE